MAVAVPEGPGYSVLLILHVAAALVGFGALLTTGLQAFRARRGPNGPSADAVRRFFRPGVNWPGRALYAVPVLGFGLVADSNGAFTVADAWVLVGLALWVVAAGVAEAVVWPGERRIQAIVTECWDDPGVVDELGRLCRQVAISCAAVLAVFLVAVVVMVAKP